VAVDRQDAARAAQQRAAELNDRLTQLGSGATTAPHDVQAGRERVVAARRRLREALLRSAEAHRSAAAMALKVGKQDDADRHLVLADVDARAVQEMDQD
jgi:hypothetical protein